MDVCKNCGEPVTILPHVCKQFDSPVLLQMKKSDLQTIIRSMWIFLNAFQGELHKDTAAYEKFMKLYHWLCEQNETC